MAKEGSLNNGNNGPAVSACTALKWCNSPKSTVGGVKGGRQGKKKCSTGDCVA